MSPLSWIRQHCKFAQVSPQPSVSPQPVPSQTPPTPPTLPTYQPLQAEDKVDLSKYDALYPMAGSVVSGLKVRAQVPNTSSIRGLSSNYEVLKGIREVSMAMLNTSPASNFYAADDHSKWKSLSEQIKASGELNPLIVVHDKEAEAGTAGPYVLEGGHRLVALGDLKVKSFPAMVVIDFEAIES